MEDEKKEFQSQEPSEKEKSKLERFKSFAYRHRKKIIFGVGSLVIIGGTGFFFKKNPEYGEELMYKLRVLIGEGDPEIIDIANLTDSELDDLVEEADEIIPGHVDLGETFSARRIGNMTGESDRQINALLKEKGFMEGTPDFYRPTSKGEPFCIEKAGNNGYGGYAARSWGWLEWSKDIIPLLGLKDPEEHLEEINKNRAMAGLEPLKEIV